MIALLAMLTAIVLLSGCTSGPATNATTKPPAESTAPTAPTVRPTAVPMTNTSGNTVQAADANGVTQDSGTLNATATPIATSSVTAANNTTNMTDIAQRNHNEAIKGMIVNNTRGTNGTRNIANVSS